MKSGNSLERSSLLKLIDPEDLQLSIPRCPYPQKNDSSWSIRNIIYPDYDLFICEKGSGVFFIGTRKYAIKPGDMLLVPPDETINAEKDKTCPILEMTAQHFTLLLFGSTDFFQLITYRVLVDASDWALLPALLEEIKKIISTGPTDSKQSLMKFHAITRLIIMEFISRAYSGDREQERGNVSLILSMISHIRTQFKKPDVLQSVMTGSPYGYSHTANLFKKHTGSSPKEYIQKQKIACAKKILLTGGNVRTAAAESGFEDELYFSRLFKKYEKIPPSRYAESFY